MTRARSPVLAATALVLLGASVASLSLAQNPGASYILAPSTRTVAPARVITTFPSNYDFVHPGDAASESAHGFQESGGSATSTATVLGRSMASGAGAWISYTLRVPQNQPFSLRIDDVGSERGVYEYSVQVNGTTVHTRSFACHIGWGKTYGGCQSYTFDLPSSYSSTGDVTVRFTWASGSPARIAAVWALGSAALPDPARGGTVSGMAGLPAGSATITSNSSASGAPYILYDFGVPMCGTFSFSYSTTGSARVKVARSNSRAYAGIAGDGVSDTGPLRDESRDVDLSGSGSVSYFPPGSDWTFRYVMLMLCTPGTVTISNVRMAYEAVPNMANPASYRGYFYCNDTALNRVWYAGAYTAQTCTREYLLDGGKRDRSLWGGDLEAAGPTVLLSYYDIAAVRDGYRKFFGPGDGWYWPGQDPVTGYLNHYSPIYHVMTTLGFAEYFLYTRDTATLAEKWDSFRLGVEYVDNNLQNGLFNQGGGYFCYYGSPSRSSEATAYAYRLYVLAAMLADHRGESALAAQYRQTAQTVKDAINGQLWNAVKGAYMHAPDKGQYISGVGTSVPITYGIAPPDRAASIIGYLTGSMRNAIGYFTIDNAADGMPQTLSPFAGGYVLEALFVAGRPSEGIAYVKSTWHHMLTSVYGNNSTFWETLDLDGMPTYDGYDSYGHCWSSAPTRVLTERVLGVRPLSMGYLTYAVMPMPSGLTHVEGTVPCPGTREIAVSYDTDNSSAFSMTVNSASHPGSQGTIGVPRFGRTTAVRVNGTLVWDGAFHAAPGIGGASQDSAYVRLSPVLSGTYEITAEYSGAVAASHQAGPQRSRAAGSAASRVFLLNGAVVPDPYASSRRSGSPRWVRPLVRSATEGSGGSELSGLSR